MIALKAVSSAKQLRAAFNKCFNIPSSIVSTSNANTTSATVETASNVERISSFHHLNKSLEEVFSIFTNIASKVGNKWHKPQRLYQSINISDFSSTSKNIDVIINDYIGKHNGLLMVTSDLRCARIQANTNGMILVLKPRSEGSDFEALDISWLTQYPS